MPIPKKYACIKMMAKSLKVIIPMKHLFSKTSMIVIFLALTSCATNVRMSPVVSNLGIEKKIPVEAALLITEETKNYVFWGRPDSFVGWGLVHYFPLGRSLEEASLEFFSQVFEKVSVVRKWSQSAKYKIVIEPRIEDFHFRYLFSWFIPPAISRIKLKMSVWDDKNSKIWEKSLESPEIEDVGNSGNQMSPAGSSASNALVQTLQKLTEEMMKDPLINNYLASIKEERPLLQQKITDDNPQSFVERVNAGVWVINNDKNEFEVASVSKNSPAGRADIQKGDILISIDGIKFPDRLSLLNYYERKNPGDLIDVDLRRKGSTLNKQIELTSQQWFNDLYILMREIIKEKPINLAVIIGDINNVYLKDKDILEQWKSGMKTVLYSDIENTYLKFFALERSFNVVDRAKTEKILNEEELQLSGITNTDSQIKVGNLLGATHLLLIDYSRFYEAPTRAQDIETRKLIEVKSGKTLANVLLKIPISIEPK